jgi:hypothetical protein
VLTRRDSVWAASLISATRGTVGPWSERRRNRGGVAWWHLAGWCCLRRPPPSLRRLVVGKLVWSFSFLYEDHHELRILIPPLQIHWSCGDSYPFVSCRCGMDNEVLCRCSRQLVHMHIAGANNSTWMGWAGLGCGGGWMGGVILCGWGVGGSRGSP